MTNQIKDPIPQFISDTKNPPPPTSDAQNPLPQPPLPPTPFPFSLKRIVILSLLILALLITTTALASKFKIVPNHNPPSSKQENVNSLPNYPPPTTFQPSGPLNYYPPTLTSTPFHPQTPEPTPTPVPITILTPPPNQDTANWKTYTNETVAFSLKYPPQVIFEPEFDPFTPITNLTLRIYTETYQQVVEAEQSENSLDSPIHFRIGYGSSTFQEDLPLVQQGLYGHSLDFTYPTSRQLFKLDNHYIKAFTVLGRFGTEDVTFEKTAIVYPKPNLRIIIKFYAPEAKIALENPEHFKIVKDKYAEWLNSAKPELAWGMDTFHAALLQNQTGPLSQDWYHTFPQILSTFKFTD
jgi:hypothetical protein